MFTSDMDDVFSALFGAGGSPFGMMNRASAQRSRRSRDVTHTIPVTLSDLYNGKTLLLDRRRTILCTACNGTGLKSSAVQQRSRRSGACPGCRGSGVRVMVRQMGMMVQQMQTECNMCNGTGARIDPRDVCERCAGQKVEQVEAPVTVVVERGMSHGQQLLYPGMADMHADAAAPGDLVIVLQQVKHDTFVRRENDLHLRKRLTLAEALCGFQFKLQHLDGRELVVRRTRGEVTAPGSAYCVVGEGMPIAPAQTSTRGQQQRGGNGGSSGSIKYGNLVIEFEVAYPDHLQDVQVAVLREALPPPRSVDVGTYDQTSEDAGEVYYVTRHDLDELRREIAKEEQEEAADEAEEGPGVGCAQQ